MRDRYWHNMASRIQRAWRNYMRYKNEAAARIQRFWKNNKEGIAYAQVRDYGHQVLAGRKERRRYSLLSYRRFMGDYLDVGGKQSSFGETIRGVCGIGCEFMFIFSCESGSERRTDSRASDYSRTSDIQYANTTFGVQVREIK
jgi:myosin-1